MGSPFLHMLDRIILLFFLAIPMSGVSQEICDNGADDDGNGLIDLQDPYCDCEGITIIQDVTHYLPNPSFENFSCCPGYWAQINCATGWENLNQGSPDFHHGCDFIGVPIQDAGLTPFPDGDGVGGIIFSSAWKEYLTTCLSQPLQAGKTYTLRMEVASVPITGAGGVCNGGNVYYGPVPVSVFGRAACSNQPLATLDCPGSVDVFWVELASVVYAPASAWSTIEITLTPAFAFSSIMIGPPCVLPAGYTSGQPCYPYFLFDGLVLEEIEEVGPLDIAVSGHPCSDDLMLLASAPVDGGAWQWYHNGVAIFGETGASLFLDEAGYQPGIYTARYMLGGECLTAEVVIDFQLPEPVLEDHYFCPGDTVICAGQPFATEGLYDVVLPSWLGCDSLVQCLILEYPFSPPVPVVIRHCGPDTVIACGDTLTQSGIYTAACTNIWGCDSIVTVDLAALNPQALIAPVEDSGCDTTPIIRLDGSLSPPVIHPAGQMTFHWSGPAGGLSGNPGDSVVWALKEGWYCLEVTHSVDTFSCRDTTCISLSFANELPGPPLLDGPAEGCFQPGIGLTWKVSHPDSMALLHAFSPGAVQPSWQSDSVLVLAADQPGLFSLCVYAENGCGRSDTVCVLFTLHSGHSTNKSAVTCDPLEAGFDTLFLINQFGCDSLVITEKILGENHVEWQTVTLCGSGTNYSDTVIVSGGPCDSLFITDYQYVAPDTTLLSGTTCDAAQAGTFTTVLQNQSGCDSTIITTVALLPVDSVVVTGDTCDPAGAVYEVITLTNQHGCDSVVTRSIQWVGTDTTFVSRTSCDSAQTGVFVHILPMAGAPCDSVVVETVTWAAQSVTVLPPSLRCDPTGPAADTTLLTASSGCDSLVIRPYAYTLLEGLPEVLPERCAGAADGQLSLAATSGSAPPWQYRLDAGPWQPAPVFSGLAPGVYTLSVQDANGCTRSWEGLVIQPGESLALDAGPDREVDPGALVSLAVTSPLALAQVQWSATDPLQCATCTATALGPVTVSQWVTVQGWTAAGCTATDGLQITLRETDIPAVYIPNSFSPNGDGINDVFAVYGNGQVRTVRHLAVYDRWGNALYQQSHLPVNDPSAGWDGTFRGRLMDPGVYVYVIELELSDGSVRVYKGDVTVVR